MIEYTYRETDVISGPDVARQAYEARGNGITDPNTKPGLPP